MTKKKKILISSIAIFCALVFILSAALVYYAFWVEPIIGYAYTWVGVQIVGLPLLDTLGPYDVGWMSDKSLSEVEERYGPADLVLIDDAAMVGIVAYGYKLPFGLGLKVTYNYKEKNEFRITAFTDLNWMTTEEFEKKY